MDTLVSIQCGLRCVGFISYTLDVCDQAIEIIYDERRMCLARGSEFRFNTEMEPDISGLEPCSAAFCQIGRFWNFCKAQQTNIKGARLFFFTGWHGDLDVVD